jgi:hypothetical protein
MCQAMIDDDERRIVQVPTNIVQKTFEITENNYTGKGFGELEWKAAIRKLNREKGNGYTM